MSDGYSFLQQIMNHGFEWKKYGIIEKKNIDINY